MKTVLMISMRDACRSSIAEGAMIDIIEKAGLLNEWKVFSAFTVGSQSSKMVDKRAISILKRHGIDYQWQARKVTPEDLHTIDYVFCMDDSVKEELLAWAPKHSRASILMLGDFGLSRWDRYIMNPYNLVGEENFEIVFQQCYAACDAFLKYALVDKI